MDGRYRISETVPFADSEHEVAELSERRQERSLRRCLGTTLDIDFGSYPLLHLPAVCAGACTGLGVASEPYWRGVWYLQAYCTREVPVRSRQKLFDETGDKMCTLGHEFGSVTGQNAVADGLTGSSEIFRYDKRCYQTDVMKSNVLDTFDTIQGLRCL